MSIENFLKPRYKVIADYPGSKHKTGEIFHFGRFHEYTQPQSYFDKYPHLFRPLAWWEDREEKDMPEYVCWQESANKEVGKVIQWEKSKQYGIYCTTLEGGGFKHFPGECSLTPATEEEYLKQVH